MSDPLSQELPCHNCGYDLRAHPKDGTCPECHAPVAEAISQAAIPTRPTWPNSDPRWRRRLLLGLWTLTVLPLLPAAFSFGWTSLIPAPTLFDSKGMVQNLSHTLFSNWYFSGPFFLCCGFVLLFAKERHRRPAPFDWTRRWGILFCYLMFFLTATEVLFIPSFVLIGIAAVFISIPPEFAPPVTQLFADVGFYWLRYGPHPSPAATALLTATSSITLLLACGPLSNALRSTTRSRIPLFLLAPLPLFAILYLAVLAYQIPNLTPTSNPDIFILRHYFAPNPLALNLIRDFNLGTPTQLAQTRSNIVVDYQLEALKHLSLLSITLYLTHAQLLTHFRPPPPKKQPPA